MSLNVLKQEKIGQTYICCIINYNVDIFIFHVLYPPIRIRNMP